MNRSIRDLLLLFPRGGFKPTDIAGCLLWLRSDRGLFTDAAMTTPSVNDGDAVQAWADQSGNGNNFTQATAGKIPTLQNAAADVIADKGVVRFNGTSDLLVASNFTSVMQGTVFAAFRMNGLVNSHTILASSDEVAALNYVRIRSVHSTLNPSMSVLQRDGAPAYDGGYGNTALVVATPYVGAWSSNGIAYSLRLNGTIQTLTFVSGANTGDWFGDTSGRDNFTVGGMRRDVDADFLMGDLCEVIMYDATLSPGQIVQVHKYLAKRWGIALAMN